MRRSGLPEPAPAVAVALSLLPVAPGVYRMRDTGGRVLYVGRSGDLRARVRSYWRDLGDRPRLARMLLRVAWLEPIVCDSEHEAALFERHLLQRSRPRYNRTTGVEQLVHLCLSWDSETPSLDCVVDPELGMAGVLFGPYLGWEPVRLAASALNRLYPIRYTAVYLDPSRRALARSMCVDSRDRRRLADRIQAVLCREPTAVAATVKRLIELRDRAADDLQFEVAAELQRQIHALRWILQARLPTIADRDIWALARIGPLAVIVRLEVRDGRLHEHQATCGLEPAGILAGHYRRHARPGRVLVGYGLDGCAYASGAVTADDRSWLATAQANADLTARLAAAGALPLSGNGAPQSHHEVRTGDRVSTCGRSEPARKRL